VAGTSCIYDIFRTRGNAYENGMIDSDENAWTFGQLLPLVLLIIPCLALFDTVQESRSRHTSGSVVKQLSSAPVPVSPSKRCTTSLTFVIAARLGIEETDLSAESFRSMLAMSVLFQISVMVLLAVYVVGLSYLISKG